MISSEIWNKINSISLILLVSVGGQFTFVWSLFFCYSVIRLELKIDYSKYKVDKYKYINNKHPWKRKYPFSDFR